MLRYFLLVLFEYLGGFIFILLRHHKDKAFKLIKLPKESIHSFIFRSILLNGGTDFSSVLGSRGLWLSVPHLPTECNLLVTSYSDLDLLRLLQDTGLANEEHTHFSKPASYLGTLKRVFPSQNYSSKMRKGAVHVAYCTSCISDAIHEYGFAYFHGDWITESFCPVHNVELRVIPENNRKEAITIITNVLSGFSIYLNSSVKANSGMHSKEYLAPLEYYLMPCFNHKFYLWLTHFIVYLMNKNEFIEGLSPSKFFLDNQRRKSINREYLTLCFYIIKEQKPKEFEEFIRRHTVDIQCTSGFKEQRAFTYTIRKLEKNNCSKCLQFGFDQCCNNQLIAKFSLINADYQKPVLNWCDYHLIYGISVYEQIQATKKFPPIRLL